MMVLGIDTSTMTGGAALVNQQGLVGEYILNLRTTHSERLMPAIEQLLIDADCSIDALTGIAVVTGPGSFTGLRIGVASAKGFAYALRIPVIGVTTFQALAWQHQTFAGYVCPIIDAKHRDVYAQVFQGNKPVTSAWSGSIDSVIDWCANQTAPVLLVGDGVGPHRELIQSLPNHVLPGHEGIVVRSSAVACLGATLLAQGEASTPFALAPFYMRKSSAEARLERLEGEEKNGG